MENHNVPKSGSILGNGDIPSSIPSKPRRGLGRGMCLFGPDGGLSSERGGGEGREIRRDTGGGFACETLLKQISGDKYKQIWKDYNLLIPPVIPNECVDVCTRQDGVSEKVLGRGGFGFVVEALLIYPRGQVKEVVLKESHKKEGLEQMRKEARICMYLERTGYVPICFGLTPSPKEEGVFRIIQECIGRGLTLHVAFRGLVPSSDCTQWLDIAFQLAEGLSKIHIMDVLVNDIKADNILIDFSEQRPVIKYCDFGLSSYKKGVGYGNVNRLLSPHLAPEHSGPSAVMTTKAGDVFGLGRLIRTIYFTTKLPELIPIVEKMRYFEPTRRCSANEALRDLSSVFLEYVSRRRLELQRDVSASSSSSSSSSSLTSTSSLSSSLSLTSTSSLSSSASSASSAASAAASNTPASAASELRSMSSKPLSQSAAYSAQPSAEQSLSVPTPSEDVSASASSPSEDVSASASSPSSRGPTALHSTLPEGASASASASLAASKARTSETSAHQESSASVELPVSSDMSSTASCNTASVSPLEVHRRPLDDLQYQELVMSDLGSLEEVDSGGSITIIPVIRLEDISLGGPGMDQSASSVLTSQDEEEVNPDEPGKQKPSFMDKVARAVFRAVQFGFNLFKS